MWFLLLFVIVTHSKSTFMANYTRSILNLEELLDFWLPVFDLGVGIPTVKVLIQTNKRS